MASVLCLVVSYYYHKSQKLTWEENSRPIRNTVSMFY